MFIISKFILIHFHSHKLCFSFFYFTFINNNININFNIILKGFWGSADDKGQFYMHVKALEIMTNTNTLKANIKFLIEVVGIEW